MNENIFVIISNKQTTKIDESLSDQFRPSQNDRLIHIFQNEICREILIIIFFF